MSSLTRDAAQEVLAAKRALSSARDRQARMALQRLCHAVEDLIAWVDGQDTTRAAQEPAGGDMPEIMTLVYGVQRWHASSHQSVPFKDCPSRICQTAQKVLDSEAPVVHTAGMAINHTED